MKYLHWMNLFFVILNSVVGASCLADGRWLLAGLNFFAVYLNYKGFVRNSNLAKEQL
jgi:hypothetical protein